MIRTLYRFRVKTVEEVKRIVDRIALSYPDARVLAETEQGDHGAPYVGLSVAVTE